MKAEKTIQLDKSRLHGFKIDRSTKADPAQAIGQSVRPGSTTGAKIGTKGGAKVGMKN